MVCLFTGTNAIIITNKGRRKKIWLELDFKDSWDFIFNTGFSLKDFKKMIYSNSSMKVYFFMKQVCKQKVKFLNLVTCKLEKYIQK
ncbi:MAG: hypothetical protein ABS68_05395 [Niastella sp. SCN 39-18]|nr:MAG: hypothetical protein ABS68_05395 [Niastella sp. SCN 39-18]OJW11446.1 MAG: hypothetical protein BGO53_10905 [Sphingobacteriales bacterium 39-19]